MPTYMPWPADGESLPTDRDVVLYIPMARWAEVEYEPNVDIIARNEEIEGVSYEQATGTPNPYADPVA